MSIREMRAKIKGWREGVPELLPKLLGGNVFWTIALVLAATASFALGRLSAMEEKRQPVKITFPNSRTIGQTSGESETHALPASQLSAAAEGKYVGSKNGTKYHLPWCSGAKRIAEKNKIRFATKEDAEKAGYTPAGNCPGI